MENRMKFATLSLALLALTISFSAVALISQAQEEETQERKYTKSFEDEDLSGKDLSKQNLDNCNFENANLTKTRFEGASMKNCNFRGATIDETNFVNVDLTGSDFREAVLNFPMVSGAVLNKVNFEGLDLSKIGLHELKARGANFRNVKGFWYIYKADFFDSDFRGANVSQAIDFSPATFRKAKYDQFTRWHKGFDPEERGAVFVETKEEPAPVETEKPLPKTTGKPDNQSAAIEAAFAKLDGNSDGVLSGKEMAKCKDRDANDDGEVTLAEYLAGEE
jgi:uncharacterized protein YjbI with pentapeptide repeats